MNELNTAVETAQEVANEVTEANGKKVLVMVLGTLAVVGLGAFLYKKHKANKTAKLLSVAETEVANEVHEVCEEPKSEDEE